MKLAASSILALAFALSAHAQSWTPTRPVEFISGSALRADSPIKSAGDLLAKLKVDPASVSMAVGTAFGGSGHIALALAAKGAGAEDCKAAFKTQHAQMHAGLSALGLAKR